MKFEALNNYECDGQLSMFDPTPGVHKPGDWTEENCVGRELTFDEAAQMIGKLIVDDLSTTSRKCYKVVQIERIAAGEDGYRLLFYNDGTRQPGIISERFFDSNLKFPARIYELK
jgi:hypothetical protein